MASARQFAVQPILGQRSLQRSALDQIISQHFDISCHAPQEFSFLLAAPTAIRLKGALRETGSAVHVLRAGGAELRRKSLPVHRIESGERPPIPRYFEIHDRLPAQIHGFRSYCLCRAAGLLDPDATFGRFAIAVRIRFRASSSSAPASGKRGGRTRLFPIPTISCTSLTSCTNLGTVSRRSRGRNQR